MMESEEDFSIVLSEEQMRRVEVPENESCLFWAVALPYLIQVSNNPDLFNQRFERLFGEKELIHAHHVHNLINEFRTSHYNSNIYDDEILRHLVSRVFRHKLVDRMKKCEDVFYESVSVGDFKDMKNESFVTDGTFRDHFQNSFSVLIEGSGIDLDKLKPEVLDEKSIALIDTELDKIERGDLFQWFMFRMYLEAMRSSSSCGGNREIRTMQNMLECEIIINPVEIFFVADDKNSIIICLFNHQQVRYQFYLVKAQFLIEFIDQNSEEMNLEYLKIGVDEINYQNSNGSTLLHFAAKSNHVRLMHLLISQGADVNIRNHLGQAPLDFSTLNFSSSNQESNDILKSELHTKGNAAILNLVVLGNSELLENFINKSARDNPNFFKEVFSKMYEEIKSLNIPISQNISLFIESQVINSCFYSHRKVNEVYLNNNNENDVENIKGRINLVIKAIKLLSAEMNLSEIKYDEIFLFLLKFVVFNTQILKHEMAFSYGRIPWIEMQFCLLSFSSKFSFEPKRNELVYELVSNKARLKKYLQLFQIELEQLKNEVKLNSKCSFRNRNEMVKAVIAFMPGFKHLYEDYELLRDVYSLKRIESYLIPACSVNLKEGDVLIGEQVILRALQVTGECLKNSIESPNMSEKVHHLLITLAPKNVIKIVTSLRDSLSHVEHLHKEKDAEDQSSLSDIQNDLMKLKDEITFILFVVRNFALEIFFNRLSECETIYQAKEIIREVHCSALREVDVHERQNRVLDKVADVIEKLKMEIINLTDIQRNAFKNVESIVEQYRLRLAEVRQKHVECTRTVNWLIRSMEQDGEIELIKKRANIEKVNLDIQMKINSVNVFEGILKHCYVIYNSLDLEERNSNVIGLDYEMFRLIELEAKRVKSIDRFRAEMAKEIDFEDEMEKMEKSEENVNDILGTISKEFLDDEIQNEIEIKKEVYHSKNTLIMYYAKVNDIYNNIVLFYDYFRNYYDEITNFFGSLIDFYTPNLAAGALNEKNKLLIKLVRENNFDELFSELNLKNSITEISFKNLLEKVKSREIINVQEIFNEFKFDKLVESKQAIDKNFFIKLLEQFRKKSSKKIKDEEKIVSLIDESVFQLLVEEIKRDLSLNENIFSALIDNVQFKLKKGETHKMLFSDFSSSKCKTILNSLKRIDVKIDSFGKLVKDVSKESEIAKLSEPFKEFFTSLPLDLNEDINNAIDKGFENIKNERIIKLKSYFFKKLEILTQIFPGDKSDLELLDLLKTDDNIRIAVEMLVLNLTETLDQLSLFEKNRLYLDECSPVLVGKNLRNYVAHGDPLINILPTNYHISLINHFRLFQREFHKKGDFYPRGQLIGKVTTENLLQVQENYQRNLAILDWKFKLFDAIYDSEIQTFFDLIINSSYLKVRNFLGDTLLHFSVLAKNLRIFQHLLEHGLNVFVKNKYGHSAIYMAIAFGSDTIIEFLLDTGFDPSFIVDGGQTLLHLAIQSKQLGIVKLLLKYGADIEAVNNEKVKPVMMAVFHGLTDIAVALINAGCDVNARDKDGHALVNLAASHAEILQTLIDKKVDVNSPDRYLNTPLHRACGEGHEPIVKMLLDNGANVNSQNVDGITPLHFVAREGHVKIVELLLIKNADINAKTLDGKTALGNACFDGHADAVQLLIKFGVDLNARIGDDMTALHLATIMGHRQIVDILLDHEVDIDSLCKGSTALHFAAVRGMTEVFKTLVARGANVALLSKDERESVLHCASRFENVEIMEYILEEKNNSLLLLNGVDYRQRTPLHLAVLVNKIKSVRVLLDKNADLEVKDVEGRTALLTAVVTDRADIFNALLEKKANVEVKDASGCTVVHAAAQNNNKAIVTALIKRNMNVNVRNNDGLTALHLTSKFGYLDMVKFLLKNGAEMNAKDSSGRTALDFATLNDDLEMKRYLRNKNDNSN